MFPVGSPKRVVIYFPPKRRDPERIAPKREPVILPQREPDPEAEPKKDPVPV